MSSLVKCPQCGRETPAIAPSPGMLARCRHCMGPLYNAKPVSAKKEDPSGIPKAAIWLGIGGGALLLGGGCLAVVLTSVGILFCSGAATPPMADEVATALGGGPSNVTIDAPVPPLNLPSEAEPEPTYALQSEVDQAAEDATYEPQPDWTVVPDGYAGAPIDYADEPIDTGAAAPLMASMDGPFAVVNLPKEPYDYPSTGLKPDDAAKYEAPKLIDLRTGQAVGTYDVKAPTWRNGRLSPDGQFVVGPDTTVGASGTREQGKVFVWKPGAAAPSGSIDLAGVLLWLDFVGPRSLATATMEETLFRTKRSDTIDEVSAIVATSRTCRFRIFDVTTGRATLDVELPEDDLAFRCYEVASPGKAIGPNGETDAADEYPMATEGVYDTSKGAPLAKLVYAPRRAFGAVTPGGKFVVLTGRNHLTVVSIADGAVKGRLPLPEGRARYASRGLGFAADGRRLHGVIDVGSTEGGKYVSFFDWDMTDGRRLRRNDVGNSDNGGRPIPAAGPFPLFVTMLDPTPAVVFALEATSYDNFQDGQIRRGHLKGVLTNLLPPDHAALYDGASSLRVVKLDLPTLADLRGMTEAERVALEPRPAPQPADRSAIATIAPAAPATWAVPAPPAVMPKPAEAGATIFDWPQAWADEQAAYINYEEPKPYWVRGEGAENYPNATAGSTNPYIRPVWRKIDVRTGKEAGEPVILWPWAAPTYETIWIEPSLAALTPAADRLAYVDAADETRVDVWDAAGARLAGFRPYGESQPIEWVGWAGDNLWTLCEGKLTGWAMPACKAICEIDGGYQSPVLTPPGRAWLAAGAEKHVDIVDASTGAILGRCDDPAHDDWRFMSLSPDGKTLSRFRNLEKRDASSDGEAHLWDLTTGKKVGVQFVGTSPAAGAVILPDNPHHRIMVGGQVETLLWIDPRRFFGVATYQQMIDLDAQGLAAVFNLAGYGAPRDEPQPDRPDTKTLSGDPFGRVWINVARVKGDPFSRLQRKWVPIVVPAPEGKPDSPLAAADREYAFKRGDAIRVDVDFVTNERAAKLAQRIAGLLQNEGFVIGPNGWTMDVTVSMIDAASATVLEGPGSAYRVPAAERKWKLKAPDGTVVKEWIDREGWNVNRSKYLTSSDTEYNNTATVMYTDHFNFGLEDPRQAIYDEILDTMLEPTEISWEFPRAVVKQGGKFHALPIETELTLPPQALTTPAS